VLCFEATPKSVLRAAARIVETGVVDPLYVEVVAVALVVASVGVDVTRLREALATLPATADAPVLTMDSVAGDGLRTGSDGAPHLTLAWPFRLRDVMDAITTAVTLQALAPAKLRAHTAQTQLMVVPCVEAARIEAASGGVSRS
jgi:hypothetical protein